MPRIIYTNPTNRDSMIDDIVMLILEEVLAQVKPEFAASHRALVQQERDEEDKALNIAGVVAQIKGLRHEGILVASPNEIRAKANEIYETSAAEWDHHIEMYAATLPRS